MLVHPLSEHDKLSPNFQRYKFVLCCALIFLPLLIVGWAYNHISLASDDWLIFGYGLQGITQDETDAQRPLLQPVFTLLTQISGGRFDLLMLLNLWVFPALASVILFLALVPLFRRWFDCYKAVFIAFLITLIFLTHPANSSRPWLTMIAYHLTHILFFGVLWLWVHAVTQNRVVWVVVAAVLMIINQLMVETQSFMYLLMPIIVVWRWSSIRQISRQWWMVSLAWYGIWLAYMVWRVLLSDGALRGAQFPTPIGSVIFMAQNLVHSYRVAVTNIFESMSVMLRASPTMLFYTVLMSVAMAAFLGWSFVQQRNHSSLTPKTKLSRPVWITLIYVGIAITFASLAPYLLYFGERILLPSEGIDSRVFQMVVIGISFLTVVALLFEKQLRALFVVSMVLIIGGLIHQLRLTYDYVQANNFQHTFWSQLLELPLEDVELVIVVVDEHYGMARIDGQSWGMISGLALMGEKEAPSMYNLNQLRDIRVEGDRLHVISQRESSRFSYDVALDKVRIIQTDDNGFMRMLPIFEVVPRNSTEVLTIELFTGFNRPPSEETILTELGRWYFTQPHTITACWTEVSVTTSDSAPSDGAIILTDTTTQQMIDRRLVRQREPLDYVAHVECGQSLEAKFLSTSPQRTVLTSENDTSFVSGGANERSAYKLQFAPMP